MRIYTDDHPPPLVHVIGDGETKVALGSAETPPYVLRVQGAAKRESARALNLVAADAMLLRQRWIEMHG